MGVKKLVRGVATPGHLSEALDDLGVRRGEPFLISTADDGLEELDANADGKFRADGSTTSRNAALAVYPRSGTDRYAIFMAIAASGEVGRTRDELAGELKMSPNTVRPRVVELLDNDWLEVAELRTRKTVTGADSEVLILSQKGWREYVEKERRWQTQPPLVIDEVQPPIFDEPHAENYPTTEAQ